QLGSAGIPPAVGAALAQSGGAEALTGVGGGAAMLQSLPADVRAIVEPYLPAILDAMHGAFSVPTSNTFVLGIYAISVAAGCVLRLAGLSARAGSPLIGPASSASVRRGPPPAP